MLLLLFRLLLGMLLLLFRLLLGMLLLLFRLLLGMLLRLLLFRLLLGMLLRLSVLLLLRLSMLRLLRLSMLRLLLLFRLGFLLSVLCKGRDRGSERQEQDCCSESYKCFHGCYLSTSLGAGATNSCVLLITACWAQVGPPWTDSLSGKTPSSERPCWG
jgi:hypothetical protein